MNRKQTAYRIIDNMTDQIVFDIDCGNSSMIGKSKAEIIERIYENLIYGKRAQHFKFLTADWIKETTLKLLDKACRNWGVEI